MKKACILFLLLSAARYSAGQVFNRSELNTQLDTPWEILYGPDGFLWLTEAGGVVSRVDPVSGVRTVVYTAPDYFPGSPLEANPLCFQPDIGAGTLGLALHPDFQDSVTAFVYFVYSYNSGTPSAPDTRFRIKRLSWDANSAAVVADTNVVDSITSGYDHLGGRLLAAKRSGVPYLFLSIGDHGVSETNSPACYNPQSLNPNNYTQDPATQNGKIHRFHMNGSIPANNPIPGNSFFTRGHRNPQGLMYHPGLDILYDVEHGDRTDDEINVLIKGMNYGWKDVRGYHGDNNHPGEAAYIAGYTPHPSIANDSLVEAFYSWCDTIADTSATASGWCTVAPSGGIYYGTSGIPGWNNSLLVVTLKKGALVDRAVYRFRLQASGGLAPSMPGDPNPVLFFTADQTLNGRLRDIALSPDGKTIYLVNNGGNPNDKITVYTYDSIASGMPGTMQAEPLRLFPNPVRDILSVSPSGITAHAQYRICSVTGAVVAEGRLPDGRVHVGLLPAGLYFIHVTGEKRTWTGRFVRE